MLFSPSKLSQPFRETSVRDFALAAAVATALTFAPGKPSAAEDMSACDQFNWPVKREQTLFGSKDLQHVASGATIASFPDRGIALELQPHELGALRVATWAAAKNREQLRRLRCDFECPESGPIPDHRVSRGLD